MNRYIAWLVAATWGSLLFFFFKELYAHAFVGGMGVLPALKMIGMLIEKRLLGLGIFTPLLFVLLYTIRPFFFFPASIMTITSVFFFGAYGGFVVSYIGESCSSCLAFFVGKYFGEELGITKKITKTKIGEYFQGNAFLSIFLLRIVPLFPFDFVNYSAGVLRLPFKDYITATLLGILPGLAAFIFLGESLVHQEHLPYAIGMIAALFLLGYGIKSKYQKKRPT